MRKMRRYALTIQKAKRYVTLPEMEVTKLTPTSFEDWHTSFTGVVGRQTILSVI